MDRRPFIVALFVLLLTFCKAKQETSAQPAAAAAPPPTTNSAAVVSTPSTGVLASQDMNIPGFKAEVTEFRRKGNTLTAKVRITNGGSSSKNVEIRWEQVSLIDTAGGKKYQPLKDEENTYIAALSNHRKDAWWESVAGGESQTVWVKFPAPPPEVKTITLQMPLTPPFDDLTIQD